MKMVKTWSRQWLGKEVLKIYKYMTVGWGVEEPSYTWSRASKGSGGRDWYLEEAEGGRGSGAWRAAVGPK